MCRMKERIITIIILTLVATMQITAQTDISYDIETQGATGSGTYMPYYLVSNRHGIVSPENNSGYITADLTAEHKMGDWTIEGGAKLEGATKAYSNVYLQELYGEISWKKLSLTLGSKEEKPFERDFELSSGSWTWSGNARPIPQVKFGFNDFIAVPFSSRWLEFFFDGSYGYTMDGDWLEDRYNKYITGKPEAGDRFITRDYWYHYKRGYFRINTHKHIIFTAGIQHAAQFGGKNNSYTYQELKDGTIPEWQKQKTNLKSFMDVLIPIKGEGGCDMPAEDQRFFAGNSVGEISFQLDYQWGKDNRYKVGAYLENPYEDGSGMRKGNGWDGIWGMEYHDKNKAAIVTGAVFELIETRNQSGPLLWSPSLDHRGEEVAEFLPNGVSGEDNYYNHFYYNGYQYYGMSMGTPMLKSSAFNSDNYLLFKQNRIKAWHIGINGHIHTWQGKQPQRLGYRVLGSYRKGWGTTNNPSYDITTSTNGLLDLTWSKGPWNAVLTYAFDKGDLLGNNNAVCLRINYKGQLFNVK